MQNGKRLATSFSRRGCKLGPHRPIHPEEEESTEPHRNDDADDGGDHAMHQPGRQARCQGTRGGGGVFPDTLPFPLGAGLGDPTLKEKKHARSKKMGFKNSPKLCCVFLFLRKQLTILKEFFLVPREALDPPPARRTWSKITWGRRP